MAIDDSRVVQDFIGLVVGVANDIDLVAKADTGTQALAQLDAMPIDVVTLDLELPDVNGSDLLDLLVAQGRAGVIILSGGVGTGIKSRYPHIATFDKQALFDERAAFLAAIRSASRRPDGTYRHDA